MSDFFRFYSFQFQYHTGIRTLCRKLRTFRERPFRLFASLLLLFFAALLLLVPYGIALTRLYRNNPGPDAYFSVLLAAGQLLTVLLAGLTAFNAFSGENNTAWLLTLPIRTSYWYGASLLETYGVGLIASASMMIPAICIYAVQGGSFSGRLVLFLFYAILGAPVLPALLSYAAALLLAYFLLRVCSREVILTVFGSAFLIFALAVYLRGAGRFGEMLRSKAAEGIPGLAAYFGVRLAALFLTGLLLLIPGRRIYFSLLRGRRQLSAAAQKSSRSERLHRPETALAIRENRTLLRSPAFVLNGLPGVLLGTVFLLCVNGFPEISPAIPVCAVLLFSISLLAFVPASSYSREGKEAWLSQTLPFTPGTDFSGRMRAALPFYALSVFLTVLTGALRFRLSAVSVLLLLAIGLLGAYPQITGALLLDRKNPHTGWERESDCMKRNRNTTFGVLAALGESLIWLLPLLLIPFGRVRTEVGLLFSFLLTLASAGIFFAVKSKLTESEEN